VTHFHLSDDLPPPIPIPVSAMANLQQLQHVSFETNIAAKQTIINFKELGDTLHTLPCLTSLKIHSFITSKEFSDFLKSPFQATMSLTELRLDLEFFQVVDIGPELEEFISSKTNLRHLELLLGVRMGIGGECSIITSKTLKHCCNGILMLQDLGYLKFGIGCARHTFPDRESTLRGFKTNEERSIISSFVRGLKGVLKLVLDLGSGYLWDEELIKIIKGLRAMDELRFLAFGANFSEISADTFDEMVGEVREMKKEHGGREVIMRPVEYWEKNERSLAGVVDDFYGISEIQRCFLYLIEL